MKSQNLQVPQTKSPTDASTTAAPKSSSPGPRKSAEAAPFRSSLSEHERRRTQRVLLRVRANIHVALQGGEAKTFNVATLSVNPHGAVIVMNQSLPAETQLVLEHAGTKQRVACKVVRSPRQMAEGYHVPLEFSAPAPHFWKIDFPPSDWRPEDI